MSSPGSDPERSASDEAPAGLVAHYVRHESARVVARLTRRFGVEHLGDAEDAVQDALVVALTAWSLKGIPSDPAGWLHRVAHNALLDRVRHRGAASRALARAAEDPVVPAGAVAVGDAGEAARAGDESAPVARLGGEVGDDQLRMMFVCCDPVLPAESQLALALKVLCGFGTAEIALRLFTSEANVYKRLGRARDALRASGVELDTPLDVAARLPAVAMVLYLLFNEGYGAARRDALVRRELCEEALRLAYLLVAHPPTDRPLTRALLALFHLHTARLATRVDAAGDILLLAEQDRSAWDREHIARGLHWLTASADGEVFTRFHAEAAIAAEHVLAPSFGATRWREIAELYRLLDQQVPSPLNALNRAVAIAESDGAEAGLAALDGVRLPPGMAGYYLWDAVVGDLLVRAGRETQARPYLERAAAAAPTDAERTLMQRRLARCAGET